MKIIDERERQKAKTETNKEVTQAIVTQASKDPIPDDLKSFLVYKFTCAGCLATLTKLLIILKLGLRNISKRTTSLLYF